MPPEQLQTLKDRKIKDTTPQDSNTVERQTMQNNNICVLLVFSWIYLQVYLPNRCCTNGYAYTCTCACACAFQPNYAHNSNAHAHRTKALVKRIDNVKRLSITKLENDQRGGASASAGVSDGDNKTQVGGININIASTIKNQFQLRLAADPDFVKKSIVEVFLAAGSQLTAEVGRRGINRILPEIDFVVAGLFTAIAGKYYAMWRVARTATATATASSSDERKISSKESKTIQTETDLDVSSWRSKVPTNAFQVTLLDGETKPNMFQRMLAFIIPMPSLFQAGFIASAFGYGFTALLIALRTLLIPSYEAATVNMNILYACLYTGAFMAVVSNIRYQVLQGLIEPKIIDKIFAKTPNLRTSVIFTVRLGNGLLGSYLAISGMTMMGLQKLK